MRQCHLYRCFGADEKLLYVGISFSAHRRLSDHKTKSRWFGSVQQISIESFPSRDAALVAEGIAIRTERPLFNKAGVPSQLFELASLRRQLSERRAELAAEQRLVSELRQQLDVVEEAAHVAAMACVKAAQPLRPDLLRLGKSPLAPQGLTARLQSFARRAVGLPFQS